MADLLAATLSSDDFDDEDITNYVGCSRADLTRIAADWQNAESMSLADADDAWIVLAEAVQLRPWRSWVPDSPEEERLREAFDELKRPIHGQVIRLSNP